MRGSLREFDNFSSRDDLLLRASRCKDCRSVLVLRLILEILMNSSTQIQEEISYIEKQLEPMNEGLDQLYREFGVTLPSYVEKWMREATKRKVEERAERINEAGLEPLRRLKADLSELVARLPDLCVQAIGPSSEWPHRKRLSARRTASNDYTSESSAAASFRKAINNLGALFAKHGLLDSAPGRSQEWKPTGQGGYKYVFNPGFDERNFPCLVRYKEQCVRQQSQLDLLESKRQELAKARARDLWDEA